MKAHQDKVALESRTPRYNVKEWILFLAENVTECNNIVRPIKGSKGNVGISSCFPFPGYLNTLHG